MASETVDSSVVLQAINLVSNVVLGIVSLILGYLRSRDASEIKTITKDLDEAKKDLKVAETERDTMKTSLAKCEEKHLEQVKAMARLETQVSFLTQQVSPKPSQGV